MGLYHNQVNFLIPLIKQLDFQSKPGLKEPVIIRVLKIAAFKTFAMIRLIDVLFADLLQDLPLAVSPLIVKSTAKN